MVPYISKIKGQRARARECEQRARASEGRGRKEPETGDERTGPFILRDHQKIRKRQTILMDR